jgi:hypothetical protein
MIVNMSRDCNTASEVGPCVEWGKVETDIVDSVHRYLLLICLIYIVLMGVKYLKIKETHMDIFLFLTAGVV